MDCRITDSLLILPDQMQTLNAVLILVFIPLFQVIVYPLASMCIELTPLRKMVVGGLLASAAFVIAGFVQLSVNTTLPDLPNNGQVYVSVWNQLYYNNSNTNDTECYINATYGSHTYRLNYNETLTDDKGNKNNLLPTFHINGNLKKYNKDSKWPVTIQIVTGGRCSVKVNTNYTFTVKNKNIYFVGVSYNGIYNAVADPSKPTDGTGEFSMGIISNIGRGDEYGNTANAEFGNLALCRVLTTSNKNYHNIANTTYPCNPRRPSDFYWWETFYNPTNNSDVDSNPTLSTAGYTWKDNSTHANGINTTMYTFKAVKPGRWHLYYIHTLPKDVRNKSMSYSDVNNYTKDAGYEFEIHSQGGVYVLNLQGKMNKKCGDDYKCVNQNGFINYVNETGDYQQIWQLVPSNKVNILWQVPQIVTITAAEILFSITGYEFAYSQSAPSMKALVQALWLLTTAIGDSIIVIITVINPFSNAATQFFAYAGIMAGVIGIFALLSIFYYEYHYYTVEEEEHFSDSENSSIHSNEDRPRSPPRSFLTAEKDEDDIRL